MQALLTLHFVALRFQIYILIAKKETELLKTTYEVTLDNGMKLEFDSAGNLSDVDFED